MSEVNDAEYTLESFGNSIQNSMKVASACELQHNITPVVPIRVMVEDFLLAVRVAEPGIQQHLAIKALNTQKEHIKQQKAITHCLAHGLTAPREDKTTTNTLQPLLINGSLTFDSALWEVEFRMLYTELYSDGENLHEIQDARLERLRLTSMNEDRVVVPRFLLSDVLSQCGRKRNTAAGLDGIRWGALGCLPMGTVDVLVSLIESRINSDIGHDLLVKYWIHVAISLIPKIKNANTAKKWRPISLTSCLQKVYLAVVTKLVQYYAAPCHHIQYGCTAGKQTMEISELCRMVMQKSTRWGISLYIMRLDIHRAFDALRHSVIHDALIACECPSRLQFALLRDLSHCDISLNFQGTTWEGIPYNKGGKQGGSDTPEILKRVLDVALRRAKVRWDEKSLGADFGTESRTHGDHFYIDAAAWADDVVFLQIPWGT